VALKKMDRTAADFKKVSDPRPGPHNLQQFFANHFTTTFLILLKTEREVFL